MCIAKTTPSNPAIDDIFVTEPTANNTSSKKEQTQMSQFFRNEFLPVFLP